MHQMDQRDLCLKVRETLQLTQEDLASLLGLHQPDISRIEKYQMKLSPGKLAKLEALQEAATSLFGVYKMLVLESYETRLQYDSSLA